MIHLAIAFDQNYLSPFYALINSIFKNNRGEEFTIHAIVSGIAEKEKERIQQYALQHRSEVIYYTIDEETVKKYVLTSQWTSAVYYRLYFPLMIPPTVKRLLYLDTDTLVMNPIRPLYTTDLEPYPVGAVYDNWVQKAPQLGIVAEEAYFNSGVLLIDTVKWREQEISEKSFAYLSQYPERILFVDQDALNAVLINNWKHLDGRFNFMYSMIPEGISRKQLAHIINDKVIVHFTLQRPWKLLCKNRLRTSYKYYLKTSPSENKKAVSDFSLNQIPAFLRLRLNEFYQDHKMLQRVWKQLKGNRITK